MSQIEGTVWCEGCGVEITTAPYLKGGREYCCQDCARGWRCTCGDQMELDDERRPGADAMAAAADSSIGE
jgi:hypothetical protein